MNGQNGQQHVYDPVDVGIAYRYIEKIWKGKFNMKMKGLGYKSNT